MKLPVSRAADSGVRDLSRAALVAALRPDSGDFVSLVQMHAQRIDWPWVVERAKTHKVAGLLAGRVESGGVAALLAADSATQLRAIRAEACRHAHTARRALHELAGQFSRERIPLLVVKGSVLAECVYGDPTLRRFFDIDIVVPPDSVDRTEALLRSVGYRLGQVEKLLAAQPNGDAEARLAEAVTYQFYRRFEYELPFVVSKGMSGLAVDLHWHIAPRARLRISPQELWRHTVPVAVADTEVLTLTPAATVIHLAVHATTCAFAGFRLLHLCDVAWAAAHFGDQLDGVWELAERWGIDAHLDGVFAMTEGVLGVSLPAVVRRAGRARNALTRPAFAVAASATFLVGDAGASNAAWWKRAWNEVTWSLAMRCLRHNLGRSVRVRLSRMRWQWRRWRLARRPRD